MPVIMPRDIAARLGSRERILRAAADQCALFRAAIGDISAAPAVFCASRAPQRAVDKAISKSVESAISLEIKVFPEPVIHN